MTEHTTMVTFSATILGESKEISYSFPITANTNTTVSDISKQISRGIDTPEMANLFTELGLALISHMADNTKDPE